MMFRLLFALLVAACAPVLAQSPAPAAAPAAAPANRYAASIVPAERFESGSLAVERHGQRGTPLILIPGLVSGSWVWQETVRQFSAEHVIYVLTLPGFDGRAPLAGPVLETVRKDMVKLIGERKLVKPVLIGHSLGGFTAIALAAEQPDLIGGVISIDGLPVFPGTESMGAMQRSQMAAGMTARPADPNPAAFAQQQREYMRGSGVIDMARADALAELTSRSTPAAMMQYVAEVVASDARGQLKDIKAPVLLLVPFYDEDDSQHQMTAAMKQAYYLALMEGTPKVEAKIIAPARHFAMFDQPQAVTEAIREFLK